MEKGMGMLGQNLNQSMGGCLLAGAAAFSG